jgi:hypothetical protein
MTNLLYANLIYRSFPNSTFGKVPSDAKGFKAFNSKERVTIVLCSNATGSIRLEPLIIGKAARPVCFRQNGFGPLQYTSQKSAWMDSVICREWFENMFVPAVLEFTSQRLLVVLLLDNCGCHPQDLGQGHPFIKVKFFPPNVTSVCQPLDQGIIQSVKANYRADMMGKLAEILTCWTVAQDHARLQSVGNRGLEFGNPPTIRDLAIILKTVWEGMKDEIFINCWLKGGIDYLPEAALNDLRAGSHRYVEKQVLNDSDLRKLQKSFQKLRRSCFEKLTSGVPSSAVAVREDMAFVLAPITKAEVKKMLLLWQNSDDQTEVRIQAIDAAIGLCESSTS